MLEVIGVVTATGVFGERRRSTATVAA